MNLRNAPNCVYLKVCQTCGQAKPLTDFSEDGRYWDGHKHDCRDCERAALRKQYNLPDEPPKTLADYAEGEEIPYEESLKLRPVYCTSCGADKPATEFYPMKANATGYHTHCKECMAVRSKLRRMVQTGKMQEWERKAALAQYLKETREKVYASIKPDEPDEGQA